MLSYEPGTKSNANGLDIFRLRKPEASKRTQSHIKVELMHLWNLLFINTNVQRNNGQLIAGSGLF